MADTHPLIEGVFTKLVMTYGTTRVASMYKGQDIEVIKRHWAHELRHLTVAEFDWACSHLPADAPPNVLQFKATAHTRPQEPLKALDAPEGSLERKREVVAALKALAEELQQRRDPKAWAFRLKAREEGGERLTAFQRSCWREALAGDPRGGDGA